jgi:hypothetical protein
LSIFKRKGKYSSHSYIFYSEFSFVCPSFASHMQSPPVSTSSRKRTKRSESEDFPKRPKISVNDRRSGKWSSAEESFANQLVTDFERGLLDDCEEGCTLRSYLARRLNCAPMRISKKFAGRCIGKLAYVKCNDETASDKLNSPLERLEKNYLESFHKSSEEDNYEFSYSEDSSDEYSADSYEKSLSDSETDHEFTCKVSRDRSDLRSLSFQILGQPKMSTTDLTLGIYGLDDSSAISAATASQVEADEWKAVLTYFCGEDSFMVESHRREMARSSSSAAIFI